MVKWFEFYSITINKLSPVNISHLNYTQTSSFPAICVHNHTFLMYVNRLFGLGFCFSQILLMTALRKCKICSLYTKIWFFFVIYPLLLKFEFIDPCLVSKTNSDVSLVNVSLYSIVLLCFFGLIYSL